MARKSKDDISEWTVNIHYVDYETGKEIDINQFTKEKRIEREEIILDSAFAKIGYHPVKTTNN